MAETDIERCARAVNHMPLREGRYCDVADVVRAVLLALREPSEGMLRAGSSDVALGRNHGYQSVTIAKDVFQAMIDEARK